VLRSMPIGKQSGESVTSALKKKSTTTVGKSYTVGPGKKDARMKSHFFRGRSCCNMPEQHFNFLICVDLLGLSLYRQKAARKRESVCTSICCRTRHYKIEL